MKFLNLTDAKNNLEFRMLSSDLRAYRMLSPEEKKDIPLSNAAVNTYDGRLYYVKESVKKIDIKVTELELNLAVVV